MSLFHDEFYITCLIHNIEYPKWRKCSKCKSELILQDVFNAGFDYANATNDMVPDFSEWIKQNTPK